ncbi:MAG: hypothetical protein JO211_00210, partial [Acidobacteriaceae bacterium]|nr:hypothetical protein [Acidobacteriaceae bacterium]
MISFSLSLVSRGIAAGLILAAVAAAQQTSAPENNLLASAKNMPTVTAAGPKPVIT